MERIRLKVCGMKDPENISGLAALQPDYMGFIFYEKSPRYFGGVLEEQHEQLVRTGVFVDAPETLVVKKAAAHGLGAIQLHGTESPSYCRRLLQLFSEKEKRPELIKVFGVREDFDFAKLAAYEGLVDYFLFDTKGKHKGGNGVLFNWEILKAYPSETPFFLSGGIGIEELPALKSLQQHFSLNGKPGLLYAVDINSRFEMAPGHKDLEKVKIFRDGLSS